jgi:hypothetical protein
MALLVRAMNAERLLSEFVDAWNAGERPLVDEFLKRVDEGRRDELVELLDAFLRTAPRPSYSEQGLDEIQSDPAVRQIVVALTGDSGMLPSLLPRLRSRAKLRRDQVVSQVMETLGLRPEAEPKTARYLHELEIGSLRATRVSRRVFEALARVLAVNVEELQEAAGAATLGTTRRDAAPALMRSLGTTEEVELLRESAPGPDEWDDVDRLFLGGENP